MVTEISTTTPRLAHFEQLLRDDCALPANEPPDELAVELSGWLGSSDPHQRADVAYTLLSTWVRRGVYDDLLSGLGDGMVTALRRGLGEDGTDTVFRRSSSALLLAKAITRDTQADLLHPATVIGWGDRALSWLVRERDLRGWVPGKDWAHAVAHGAELVLALAMSRHCEDGELTVLLDTVADRLLEPTDYRLVHAEDDRLAYATMGVLHRGLLGMEVLGPWLERVASGWQSDEAAPRERDVVAYNCSSYLRALHSQLQLGVRPLDTVRASGHFHRPIEVRIELLGALARALRTTAQVYEPPK
ncbi:MAG: DUF2785 domain-containing protein [Streptosporangiales bacterium]